MDRLLEKHGEYTAERGFEAMKTVELRVKTRHFPEVLFWRKAD